MNFNNDINLFELTSKVLERFRSESGLKLDGYEFKYGFNQDWNCPIKRIRFNLFIFDEDYGHTVFDKDHDTVEKVIDLLFIHLRDDAGMDNIKDGLVSAKMYSLESRLEGLSEKIQTLSSELYEPKGYSKLITMVDEKYPSDENFYENGFPIFQYEIYDAKSDFKLYIDLDFNLRGLNEREILNEIRNRIEKAPNNR